MKIHPPEQDLPPDSLIAGAAGEMGARIAAFDWARTSIGARSNWPQSLKTTVSIMLHSPVPMVLLWGSEGVMIYNDAYTVFAADRHPEQLGMAVLEGWAEVADFNANVMRVVRGGGTLSYRDQELTLHRKGAPEQVWMNLDYSPVMDETGEPGGVLAIVVETTERVLIERQKTDERERLREMFEQAPGAVAIVRGPDHVFENANQSYFQLVGQRNVIGKPARAALPELEGQGFFKLLDEVYQTGKSFVGQGVPVTVKRNPQGHPEERLIDFVYQPLRDRDGRVTGIFAEGFDVTDRHAAEEGLRKSQRRLNAVLDNATVSVFLMDEHQHCIYMNAAAERLTGFRLDEVQGRALHDVIHHTRPDGSHYPLAECPIDRAFPENYQMQGEETFVRKDGTFFPVAYTASPIRDDDANTVGTIIEVRDIQQEKDAEERQSLLLREMSHRVKNLFSVTSGIIALSARRATSAAELADKVQHRLMALSRANDLVLPDLQKPVTERKTTSLEDVLRAVLLPYAENARGGELGRISLSGPSIILSENAVTLLALTLHETATNSAKYGALAAEHGRIGVVWEKVEPDLRIRWTETGGPLVHSPPQHTGFGTSLVRRAVMRQLSGQVHFDWQLGGLSLEFLIPVERLER